MSGISRLLDYLAEAIKANAEGRSDDLREYLESMEDIAMRIRPPRHTATIPDDVLAILEENDRGFELRHGTQQALIEFLAEQRGWSNASGNNFYKLHTDAQKIMGVYMTDLPVTELPKIVRT